MTSDPLSRYSCSRGAVNNAGVRPHDAAPMPPKLGGAVPRGRATRAIAFLESDRPGVPHADRSPWRRRTPWVSWAPDDCSASTSPTCEL